VLGRRRQILWHLSCPNWAPLVCETTEIFKSTPDPHFKRAICINPPSFLPLIIAPAAIPYCRLAQIEKADSPLLVAFLLSRFRSRVNSERRADPSHQTLAFFWETGFYFQLRRTAAPNSRSPIDRSSPVKKGQYLSSTSLAPSFPSIIISMPQDLHPPFVQRTARVHPRKIQRAATRPRLLHFKYPARQL
jgi:hypothetical protein